MKSIRKKMENKGFTLVEIIVCLAIMTIVAGSVGAFIVAGNNSYLRGNKEVTLQEEAQLAANQMIDLIIDVEKDIKFTNTTGTAVDLDGNPAKDDAGNEVQAQVGELLLVNNDNAYMIRWQGNSNAGTEYENANQVYLYEIKADVSGNLNEDDFDSATPALMAEHVSSFQVDLSEARSKRKVILNMLFAYQDKTYQISETIKLRNSLPEDTAEHIWLEAMTIIPTNPTVTQGETKRFDYELKGEPEAIALAKKQGVSWSLSRVDGTPCTKSSIDSRGIVTVGADETIGNDILRVNCKLNADPTFTATTTINVKQLEIESIAISPSEVELRRGNTQLFTCTMEGSEAAKAQGVTWSFQYKDGTSVTKSTLTPTSENALTASLTIGDEETIAKDLISVTCTSVADPAKSDTAVVSVAAIKGMYVTDLIAGYLRTYEYDDGKIGYCVDLECMTSWADYKNGYPKLTDWRVEGSSAGYTFVPNEEDPTNIFKKTLECSYNVNKKIRVTVTVQLDETTWVYPSYDVEIPDLLAANDKDAPYIKSSQFVLYRNGKIDCTLENYKDTDNVRWEFENINEDFAFAPSEEEEARAAWAESYQDNYDIYNPIKSKRIVGFSQYNASSDTYTFSKGQDGEHGSCYQLFPTATGKVTRIWAKPAIPFTEQYLLKLNAVRMDRDKGDADYVIATTYILIPECKMFFPNGTRYRDFYQAKGKDFSKDPYCMRDPATGIAQGEWGADGNGLWDYYLRIDMYGIEQGTLQENPNSLSQSGVNVTGSMIATITGKKSGTKIDPPEAFLGSAKNTSLVHLYIDQAEPGWTKLPNGTELDYEELLLHFESTDGTGINQTLVIYYHKPKG